VAMNEHDLLKRAASAGRKTREPFPNEEEE
jgi:hypothetical protein